MNRKAFIRSVESVLAIILFMGFYSLATEDLSPSLPRPDPTISARELLDTLEQTSVLNEYVNEYSMRELSQAIKQLIPPTQGFKIELSYYEPLKILNNNNQAVTRNLTITRFLPENTNTNSLKVFDEDGESLPTQIINNYYKKVVNAQASSELVNETIRLDNVRLKTEQNEKINTTSMRAFVNNEETLLELDSIVYTSNYYDANATILLLIPYAEQNSIIEITIFYGNNETDELIDYPDLGTGAVLSFTGQEPVKSKASQIRFTISLEPNEEKQAMLYYELNTNTAITYSNLTPNNQGVIITGRKEYYESTNPLRTYESKSTYSIKKNIITSDLNCLVNFKVWNYE